MLSGSPVRLLHPETAHEFKLHSARCRLLCAWSAEPRHARNDDEAHAGTITNANSDADASAESNAGTQSEPNLHPVRVPMNKAAIWLAGASIVAVLGMVGTLVTGWVQERNADHEILKQLWWKDYYLNGPMPAAPVDAPKK